MSCFARFAYPAMLTLMVAMAGCSGASPTVPLNAGGALPSPIHRPDVGLGPGGTALPGGTIADGLLQESALGIWNLQVDPATLSAKVTPASMRRGQQTDDVYELPLDNLVNPGSFEVLSITADSDSVDVTWQFTHPFAAAANIDGAATAGNRADLGISGRVLFLADVASASGNTFFEGAAGDDTLVLNPGFAQNADGFVKPRGLVTLSGFTANTFPFQALVDERNNGNRVGISNAGDVRGNYDTAEGWQKGDFGASRTGFTGYGILHQGQAVTRTARFNLAALQSGTGLDLGVAVLAKYVDPRGGTTIEEKKANRLPRDVADVTKFCYREPHGSLDIEALRFAGQGGTMTANSSDTVDLRFTLVDWDARATETTEVDLADEGTTSRVAIGSSGAPSLAVCIPGITGDATVVNEWSAGALKNDDTAIGGDTAQDTGRPGDGLYFTDAVQNEGTGQSRGVYYGVVRAIDPEDEAGFASPRLFLDADLLPLSADLPRVRVYQAFPVVIGNAVPAISAALESGTISSGSRPVVNVLTAEDADNDAITVEIDWNDDDVYEDSHVVLPGNTDVFTAPFNFNNPGTTSQTRTIKLRYSDGVVGPIDHPDLQVTLGTNRRPQLLTGEVQLRASDIVAPGLFIVQDDGSLNVTDPEGDPITFVVTNDRTSESESSSSLPMPGHFTAFPADLGPITFSVYATDATHPASPGTRIGQVTGRVHGPAFARRFGGEGQDFLTIVKVIGDRIYLGVSYSAAGVDFGGGGRPVTGEVDAALIAYELNGRYLWDRTIHGGGSESIDDVAVNSVGDLFVVGAVSSSTDFGGGALGTMGPRSFLGQYASDGGYLAARYLNVGGPGGPQSTAEAAASIAISPDDSLTVVGYYQGDNVNFGGGTYTDGLSNGIASFVLDLTSGGSFVAERIYNTGNQCVLGELVMDPLDQRLYIGGSLIGTQNFGGGDLTVSSGSVLFSLDQLLAWEWHRSLLQANVNSLVPLVDGFGVAVGGTYYGTTDFGGAPRIFRGGGVDGFLALYSQQGTHTDDLVVSDTGYETLLRVEVDSEGNLLASGDFDQSVNLGGGTREGFNRPTAYAVKYSRENLTWLWDALFETDQGSYAVGLACTPGDDVIVGGVYSGVVDADPSTGLWQLHAPITALDVWFQRLRGDTGRL